MRGCTCFCLGHKSAPNPNPPSESFFSFFFIFNVFFVGRWYRGRVRRVRVGGGHDVWTHVYVSACVGMRACVCVGTRAFAWGLNSRVTQNPLHNLFSVPTHPTHTHTHKHTPHTHVTPRTHTSFTHLPISHSHIIHVSSTQLDITHTPPIYSHTTHTFPTNLKLFIKKNKLTTCHEIHILH